MRLQTLGKVRKKSAAGVNVFLLGGEGLKERDEQQKQQQEK